MAEQEVAFSDPQLVAACVAVACSSSRAGLGSLRLGALEGHRVGLGAGMDALLARLEAARAGRDPYVQTWPYLRLIGAGQAGVAYPQPGARRHLLRLPHQQRMLLRAAVQRLLAILAYEDLPDWDADLRAATEYALVGLLDEVPATAHRGRANAG